MRNFRLHLRNGSETTPISLRFDMKQNRRTLI
jgi:hypothetical protein